MSRLPDEQWAMIEDSIEKKNIARSSRGKRTHCGKRGGVKFPSDFMSKKELKAMNGEVKSYKMHDPMSWKEFLALPDDLKKEYVKYIRERFKVTYTALADAFGVSLSHFCKLNKKLGLPSGRSHSAIGKRWYKSEERQVFEKWWYGEEYEDNHENRDAHEETPDYKLEVSHEVSENDSNYINEKTKESPDIIGIDYYSDIKYVGEKSVGDKNYYDCDNLYYTHDIKNIATCHNLPESEVAPVSGSLSFDCEADSAFEMVKKLLGSKKVHMYIEWTYKED